jgi:helicase
VLKERITRVIDFLLENDLLKAEGDEFRATRFGKRVSELYIDPMSAVKLREALANVDTVKRLTAMSFLHAACATPDMIPIYMRKGDEWIIGVADEREDELLVPAKHGSEYEFFLAELKTASLLHDWIEETSEEDLFKKYGAYPGDINNKVDTAKWLMYATEEIARIFQKKATKPTAELQARLVFGAKGELLSILELKGVGRYRARQLHNAGYTTKAKLAQATLADLTRVHGIGPTLALSILKETRGADEIIEQPEPLVSAVSEPEAKRDPQRGLGDFG